MNIASSIAVGSIATLGAVAAKQFATAAGTFSELISNPKSAPGATDRATEQSSAERQSVRPTGSHSQLIDQIQDRITELLSRWQATSLQPRQITITAGEVISIDPPGDAEEPLDWRLNADPELRELLASVSAEEIVLKLPATETRLTIDSLLDHNRATAGGYPNW